MNNFIKKLKLDVLLTAVLSIVLGLVFIIYPGESVITIARIIAAIIFIFGIFQIGIALASYIGLSFVMASGIIITAIGVWMYIFPDVLVSMIPLFMGLLLFCHGIVSAKYSILAARCGFQKWGIMFGFSVISILLGIVCMLKSFNIAAFGMQLIGASLIYNGLMVFYVSIRAGRVISAFKKSMTPPKEEIISVDAKVIDED